MRECWLRPNQRVIGLVIALAVSFTFAGLALVCVGFFLPLRWLTFAGGVAAAVGVIAVAVLVHSYRTPRLAYEDGHLLVFFDSSRPVRVPIEHVEVLFLGSSLVTPKTAEQDDDQSGPRTANVVVRLAETAKQWHDREVASALGQWEDGYIVLRGTWCEPIGHERLNEINKRLTEVRRGQRNSQQTAQATS